MSENKVAGLRVVTLLGTRPEIIKLSRVIPKLDRHCDHVLVHTGQNHSPALNEDLFDDLGLRRPDRVLHAAGANPAETIGKVIVAADAMLAEVAPDALLVLGDTNSGLAVIPAKRRRIPVFHMEAGNRCFDERVPEEINRRIIDHVADVNLAYSEAARGHLLREGLAPDRVIRVGSPMYEVLVHHRDGIDASDVLSRLGLAADGYFLVSAHREENVDPEPSFAALVALLRWLATEPGLPVVVSTHPRTRKRIEAAGVRFPSSLRLLDPLRFKDYVKLQLGARAVLSDSGTISEESSILNFPALNLRATHERAEAMDEASVMMVGLSIERTRQALAILAEQPRGEARLMHAPADYQVPNVSDKVLRIIQSYCDYVGRVVWREAP